MFCKKCGKEIDDGAIYCNFCGTNLAKKTYSDVSAKEILNGFFQKAIDFLAPLGENKKMFISTVILLALNPILSLFNCIKVSENITGSRIISESVSVFDFFTEFAKELPFINVLVIIGIIAIVFAEYLLLLPLIKKTTHNSKNFIVTKIISVTAVLFIILFYIIFFMAVKNKAYVKVTLTFSGWLLLIESIALVIVSFKTSSAITKRKELE